MSNTANLSPVERAMLRKQAFDNEFEIEVAAKSNYTGAHDMADIARYHGFDHIDGTRDLTLGGFYVPESEDYEVGDFRGTPFWGVFNGIDGEIPKEVGTVNAVHNQATPATWAHEYRHRDFPDWPEGSNRVMDFASAQNEAEQKHALGLLIDWENRHRDPLDDEIVPSEKLISTLKHLNNPTVLWRGMPYSDMLAKEWNRGARSTPLGKAEDIDDYIDQRHDSAYFQKTYDELDEYMDWNKGLRKRNLQRKISALPKGTPMERQFAKQERRRLLKEYDEAQ